MKLSVRLQKIVEIIPACPVIADIGTDHAYVPCELLLQGKVQRAIAADINQKPLDKAKRTAQGQGCIDRMDFRLGSGLAVLSPGEVQGAVLAGMGGELIKDLLANSPEVVQALDFLVLQPAQNPEVLRKYLYSGDYRILSEDLVRESDGRFYEYFLVSPQPDLSLCDLTDFDHLISPILKAEHHPLLPEFLRAKMEEISQIQSKLNLSYPSSQKKFEELNDQKNRYEEVLIWLSN